MATMTFYKATRPNGMSFYDGTTKWQVGRIVRHPTPDLSLGLCSAGVLHISDALGETLVGGRWPCRLFEVEPRSHPLLDGGSNGHKYGCIKVKVIRELPAWQALGPNGEAVAALIERCKTLTYGEAKQLGAAWGAARNAAWVAARDAARGAAWDSARDAARGAAWDSARVAAWDAAGYAAWDSARAAARYAAGYAAWNAAGDAALALTVKDLITPDQFDLLYGPWEKVMGS
jgi:hypothetical protein